MKTCIECGEINEWVEECYECGEYICDQCYQMHERYCRPYPRYPHADMFGMCYSDAGDNL